jgi:hypothetical protein
MLLRLAPLAFCFLTSVAAAQRENTPAPVRPGADSTGKRTSGQTRLTPGSPPAAAPRARAGRSVASDTIEFEITNILGSPDDTIRSLIEQTRAPGTGSESGQIVVLNRTVQRAGDGSVALMADERFTSDARTRTFMSSRIRMTRGDGGHLSTVSHTIVGRRIRRIQELEDGRIDTTWADLSPAGPPITSIRELLMLKRLTRSWRGSFALFNASPPFHRTFVVDSTIPIRASDGAARWTVLARSDSGTSTLARMVATVDSATQEVISMQWRNESGAAGTWTNLRFDRPDAPIEISVGYRILSFNAAFPLTIPPAAEYRFVFDPGDLGTRRFEAETLIVSNTELIMKRDGRRMTYVRR